MQNCLSLRCFIIATIYFFGETNGFPIGGDKTCLFHSSIDTSRKSFSYTYRSSKRRENGQHVEPRWRQKNFITLTSLHMSSGASRGTSTGTTTSKTSSEGIKCKFCEERFASRNLLFRHLDQCIDRPQGDQGEEPSPSSSKERHALAFRFAYGCNPERSSASTSTSVHLHLPEAQLASQEIQKAFQYVMNTKRQSSDKDGNSNGDGDGNCNGDAIDILATTQASVAHQRHRSLSQEIGCAAANDVMTISFCNAPMWFTKMRREDRQTSVDFLMTKMNSVFDETTCTRNGTNDNSTICISIRIIDISFLSSSTSTFHAENSCTQFAYNYILPLKWLKDGDQLEEWWLRNEDQSANENDTDTDRPDIDRKHPGSFRTKPPSNSLKELSNALKNAESITIPNRRVRRKMLQRNTSETVNRKIDKIAMRRLGTLSTKERRAWHNFADPQLRGEASPNQEPVWRVIDRCRIAEISKNPFNQEVCAIIEFRGDSFLPQQIRRIVGTAVGVNNGFLPEDIIEVSTRADTVITTALAPEKRLFLRDLRFHEKLSSQFDYRKDEDANIAWLQQHMFALLSEKMINESEADWLRDLGVRTAPKICKELHFLLDGQIQQINDRWKDPEPTEYSATLSLLRSVSKSGWPATSLARSKVIKTSDLVDDDNGKNEFGSFTVVNPILFQSNSSLFTLGNQVYPDVVESVFELEEFLIKHHLNETRLASSHCAINFNASFTPHVDSGTGLGQSLSMIVGLGDYSGGEIFVEGTSFPIRYKPLEFNGWKKRHWTAPYIGERFSLVWFTPLL